ncbi:MAG: sigma-70 family RNA polymerase sigma factor [Gemmatimonadales bacterium]
MAASDPDPRQRAFEALALPLLPALYNAGLHLTRSSDDAADLVQETCLRAYRTFDNFRPGTNAKAWLFTILYSVFLNRRKKARREVGPFPVDELERQFGRLMEAPESNPGATGDREWTAEVETALHALPEAYRAAVLLVDVQELSHEEAADVLGVPLGTVQSRVFRGRRLLYAALHEYARRAGYVKPDG